MHTIVGAYRDLSEAQKVVTDLVNAGIPRDDISLVASNVEDRYQDWVSDDKVHHRDDVSAGEGAVVGGVEGGLIGALLGLGALAIPGIGPIIAFGPLVGGLIGAGAGAVTGGLTAGLIDMGFDETDAETYSEAVRRGYVLVTVRTDGNRDDLVENIMYRHGAIDIDERAEAWQEQGWTGYDRNAKPYTRKEIEAEHSYHSSY